MIIYLVYLHRHLKNLELGWFQCECNHLTGDFCLIDSHLIKKNGFDQNTYNSKKEYEGISGEKSP